MTSELKKLHPLGYQKDEDGLVEDDEAEAQKEGVEEEEDLDLGMEEEENEQ